MRIYNYLFVFLFLAGSSTQLLGYLTQIQSFELPESGFIEKENRPYKNWPSSFLNKEIPSEIKVRLEETKHKQPALTTMSFNDQQKFLKKSQRSHHTIAYQSPLVKKLDMGINMIPTFFDGDPTECPVWTGVTQCDGQRSTLCADEAVVPTFCEVEDEVIATQCLSRLELPTLCISGPVETQCLDEDQDIYPTRCLFNVPTECPNREIMPTNCVDGFTPSYCPVPDKGYPTACPNKETPTNCENGPLPTYCYYDNEEYVATNCPETIKPSLCPDGEKIATACPGGLRSTYCRLRDISTICFRILCLPTNCPGKDISTYCSETEGLATYCLLEEATYPTECPRGTRPTTCKFEDVIAPTICNPGTPFRANTCK